MPAITEVLVQPSTLCVQNASPGSNTPSHFKEKLFGNDIRNDINIMEEVFRGEGQCIEYYRESTCYVAQKCLHVGLDGATHGSLATSLRYCHSIDQLPKPKEAK